MQKIILMTGKASMLVSAMEKEIKEGNIIHSVVRPREVGKYIIIVDIPEIIIEGENDEQ